MKNDYIGEMSEAMTNEKALQGFEEYCETCRKNCEEAGAELVCNCCKVKRAKEAIEKQIPKKFEIFNSQDSCPNCKAVFGNDETRKRLIYWKMDYCKYCGQALDWSE